MKETFEQLLARAVQDDAKTQFDLALCYFKGDGVEQNKQKAVVWFQKAAEQGDAEAQFELALCYFCGDGVEQDKQKAVVWFQKAAVQGNAGAQFFLACCYFHGDGVEQDKKKAVVWFQKAAEKGLKEALFCLVLCYSYGDGIIQDKQEEVVWFQKAAVQGLKEAQFKLAESYRNGIEGILSPNQSRASYWEKRANSNENKEQKTTGFTNLELRSLIPFMEQIQDTDNHIGKTDKLTEKEYVVAFIDLLGSKEKIKSEDDNKETLNQIHELYDYVNNFKEIKIENIDKLEWKIFSDNIVIAMPTDDTEFGRTHAFLAVWLVSTLFQARSMENEYTLRGGITIGNFYIDKTLVWGTGLVNAYKLENEMAVNPRLIIDHKCEKYMDGVWNYLLEQKVFKKDEKKDIVFTKDYDYWYICYQFIYYLKLLEQDTQALDTVCEFLLSCFNKHQNNEKVLNKYKWLIESHNTWCKKNRLEEYTI